MVHPERIHAWRSTAPGPGPVVYWMHREHRVAWNDGLAHAQALALELERPLLVAWFLAEGYPGANERHYSFLLGNMRELERGLHAVHIPLLLFRGQVEHGVAGMFRELQPGAVVTDFDPLRVKQAWLQQALEVLDCPLLEVDSRNVVPCRRVSDRKEYAARTIRPKIHRRLPEFLSPAPSLVTHPHNTLETCREHDWQELLRSLDMDRSVKPGAQIPGAEAARQVLEGFVSGRLGLYGERSNDPNSETVSRLSPYLHFGMLSAREALLKVLDHRAFHPESTDAFVEQLLVRRELSDNFCLHEPRYDSAECFPDWARTTLDAHRQDERPWLYGEAELEDAATHEHLWNAAQLEMRVTGHMHNYMRMYWAKKILEWSPTPEEALARVIAMNDRWSLDGRDSNGYVGAVWSIGGVHDRPWKERPVFGKIRYMNARGAARKFDVQAYVKRMYEQAGRRAVQEWPGRV